MGSCACVNTKKIKINLFYANTKSKSDIIQYEDDQIQTLKKNEEENIIIIIPYNSSQKSLDISCGTEINSRELSNLFANFE